MTLQRVRWDLDVGMVVVWSKPRDPNRDRLSRRPAPAKRTWASVKRFRYRERRGFRVAQPHSPRRLQVSFSPSRLSTRGTAPTRHSHSRYPRTVPMLWSHDLPVSMVVCICSHLGCRSNRALRPHCGRRECYRLPELGLLAVLIYGHV